MDDNAIGHSITDLEFSLIQLETAIFHGDSLDFSSDVREIHQRFEYLRKEVVDQLSKWQYDRTRAIIPQGTRFQPEKLDKIREWFNDLSELVNFFKVTISSLTVLDDDLRNCDEELFKNLIRSGFFVEEQPPQVLKTQNQMEVTVRQLVPNVGIGANVDVSILSASQVERIWRNPRRTNASSGIMIFNTGQLELDENTKNAVCNFGELRVSEIKRPTRKASETVMNAKFGLLFQSEFTVNEGPLYVWAISVPVTVIVHVDQEPSAWSTIMWDNAFSSVTRVPFVVADRVPWPELANALQSKFQSITECRLSPENLNYLCDKLISIGADPNEITWRLFAKEALPTCQPGAKKFTFSEWFYAAAKLVRDHLKKPWQKGLVVGFISKMRAAELLEKTAPGTFLLRFSDTATGGISIAYVKCDKHRVWSIEHVSPFFKEVLTVLPIEKHIIDLHECTTFYPNTWKYEAFADENASNEGQLSWLSNLVGYVTKRMKTVISGSGSNSNSSPLRASSSSN